MNRLKAEEARKIANDNSVVIQKNWMTFSD